MMNPCSEGKVFKCSKSRIQLDSLDALQIVVALQAHFNVRLQGDRMVRKHMMCVKDLAAFVRTEHQK